ncbi:uncharacterized protein SPPG_08699 [Spizellomyces punctatus DAOM BR117]|uniref:Uncharacterized protein n=1 Tax=Spizellomyces punctatus (strain DAOM BR117) TaxID=645134 RepID=A0A0L0H5E3_SPIPD|nr:uncharacterized protein SPPG_08699 [Spizellomyces punctatus DAOM BR117]KNC95948.1 hypothetical protein SPPG_08699 [Spizellomyces punctatus DAOM BR117]|eukprot:XP_016603988.1 hypothetical protein SPPG_08699 [Spizellomyces punctatus DAOM BR117]
MVSVSDASPKPPMIQLQAPNARKSAPLQLDSEDADSSSQMSVPRAPSRQKSPSTTSTESRSARTLRTTHMDPVTAHLEGIVDTSATTTVRAHSQDYTPEPSSEEDDGERMETERKQQSLPHFNLPGPKGKKHKGFFQRFRKGKKSDFEEHFGSQLSLRDLDENGLDDADGERMKHHLDMPETVKVKTNRKVKKDFNHLTRVQVLGGETHCLPEAPEHDQNVGDGGFSIRQILDEDAEVKGPIWAMRFSDDGKYLVEGGQDSILRAWRLAALATENADKSHCATSFDRKTPRIRTWDSHKWQSDGIPSGKHAKEGSHSSDRSDTEDFVHSREHVFEQRPFRIYRGHSAPILDAAWSRNGFIASASMDKTVRLWHIDREECLCSFLHNGCVTSVCFHPLDDRYLLTGSLDSRIRVWSLEEKRVCAWNETPNGSYVTAVSFTRDGTLCAAGTFDGDCIFYEFDGLKYNTQIEVRSTRDRHSKRAKITGIEPLPYPWLGEDRLLVTSNDSRIRLYNVRDKSLHRKYKGLECRASQIKATFSDDGRFIIAGSEDRQVYIWNFYPQGGHASHAGGTGQAGNQPGLLSGFMHWQSDASRSASWERFIGSTEAVTCAIFAPKGTREIVYGDIARGNSEIDTVSVHDMMTDNTDGALIVIGDMLGRIRVFQNNVEPGGGEGTATLSPHQVGMSHEIDDKVERASTVSRHSTVKTSSSRLSTPLGPSSPMKSTPPTGMRRSASELAGHVQSLQAEASPRSMTPPAAFRPQTEGWPETHFLPRTSAPRNSVTERHPATVDDTISGPASAPIETLRHADLGSPSTDETKANLSGRNSHGGRARSASYSDRSHVNVMSSISAENYTSPGRKHGETGSKGPSYTSPRGHFKDDSIEEEKEEYPIQCSKCSRRFIRGGRDKLKCPGCGSSLDPG